MNHLAFRLWGVEAVGAIPRSEAYQIRACPRGVPMRGGACVSAKLKVAAVDLPDPTPLPMRLVAGEQATPSRRAADDEQRRGARPRSAELALRGHGG
jgi:hypothetical protein